MVTPSASSWRTRATQVLVRAQLVLLLVAGGNCDDSKVGTLQRRSLSNYPSAVCMDGSPAAYYLQAAAAPPADDVRPQAWVLILGGVHHPEEGATDWCYDQSSCAAAYSKPENSDLVSSKGFPQERTFSGFFDPQKDYKGYDFDLAKASKIFVPYCTMDAWLADEQASPETGGYAYRGKAVLEAVLKDLVTVHGLGSRLQAGDAKDILVFGGQGVGARGAMMHLDYVGEMLQNHAHQVRVVGFFDSGLWLDLPPLKNVGVSALSEMTKKAHKYMNISHHGEACQAHYPNPLDHWRCMFPEYRLPYLETPYFLVEDLFDRYQVQRNSGNSCPPDKEGPSLFADTFSERMKSYLFELSINCKACAVWSSSCYTTSTILTRKGFDMIKLEGDPDEMPDLFSFSVSDAFETWMTALIATKKILRGWTPPPPPGVTPATTPVDLSKLAIPNRWIESCPLKEIFGVEGFACGGNCHPSADHDACVYKLLPSPPPPSAEDDDAEIEDELEQLEGAIAATAAEAANATDFFDKALLADGSVAPVHPPPDGERKSDKSKSGGSTSTNALIAVMAFALVAMGYYVLRVRGRLSDQVRRQYNDQKIRSYQRPDDDLDEDETIQLGDIRIRK